MGPGIYLTHDLKAYSVEAPLGLHHKSAGEGLGTFPIYNNRQLTLLLVIEEAFATFAHLATMRSVKYFIFKCAQVSSSRLPI